MFVCCGNLILETPLPNRPTTTTTHRHTHTSESTEHPYAEIAAELALLLSGGCSTPPPSNPQPSNPTTATSSSDLRLFLTLSLTLCLSLAHHSFTSVRTISLTCPLPLYEHGFHPIGARRGVWSADTGRNANWAILLIIIYTKYLYITYCLLIEYIVHLFISSSICPTGTFTKTNNNNNESNILTNHQIDTLTHASTTTTNNN